MKKILSIFCLCASIVHATDVLIPVDSMFNGVLYGKTLTITPMNGLIFDSTHLYAGSYLNVPSHGTNPIVRLQPNSYLLTAPDVRPAVRFNVWDSTNVLNLITDGLITSGPLFFFGTNGFANLLPGANITFVTNADGSILISSTSAVAANGSLTVTAITNSGVYYNTNSGYVLDAGGQVHWPSPGNGAVFTTAGDLQATNGTKIYKSGANAFGAVDGSALLNLNAAALTSNTFPLSVVPAQISTNSDLLQKESRAGLWPLRAAVDPNQNSGPIRIFVTGDSTMSAALGPINKSVTDVFGNYFGNGAGVGDWGSTSYGTGTYGFSGTEDTNWFALSLGLTNGNCYTNAYWNGHNYQPVTNVTHILLVGIKGPNGTNLLVNYQTSFTGPTSYLATISFRSATIEPLVTNIALPTTGNYISAIRTAGNGTNMVFACGPVNNSSGYFQILNFSAGGRKFLNWTNVNSHVFSNILQQLNPAVILVQSRNNIPSELTIGFTNCLNYFMQGATNRQLAFLGNYQSVITGDIDQQENDIIRAGCQTYALPYCSLFYSMPSSNIMASLGWFQESPGLHLQSTNDFMGCVLDNFLAPVFAGLPRYKEQLALKQSTAAVYAFGSAYLLAEWPADEGAGTKVGDTTGHGYDFSAPVSGSWGTGKLGKAISCADADNGGSPGASFPMLTNGLTLMGWVKTASVPDGVNKVALMNKYFSGTNGDFNINIFPSPTTVSVDFNYVSGGTIQTLSDTVTIPTVNDSAWHHWALLYDNTTLSFMWDGIDKKNWTLGGPFANTLNPCYPIFYAKAASYDDMMIWVGALTTNAVSTIFYKGGFK